jgi:vacuolar-type H+-ATPase subunit F/Vma7
LNKKLSRKTLSIIIIREKLASDLSEEISMNREEALEVIDFSLQLVDEWPISYQQLKSEIKAYIIINMFSLITKFQ